MSHVWISTLHCSLTWLGLVNISQHSTSLNCCGHINRQVHYSYFEIIWLLMSDSKEDTCHSCSISKFPPPSFYLRYLATTPTHFLNLWVKLMREKLNEMLFSCNWSFCPLISVFSCSQWLVFCLIQRSMLVTTDFISLYFYSTITRYEKTVTQEWLGSSLYWVFSSDKQLTVDRVSKRSGFSWRDKNYERTVMHLQPRWYNTIQ